MAETWNQRLTRARVLRGLSKSELARRCKVSAAAVTAWELGQTGELAAENLLRVSLALDCSPWWLYQGVGPGPAAVAGVEDAAAAYAAGDDAAAVARLLGRLTEDQRAELLGRVRATVADNARVLRRFCPGWADDEAEGAA